MSGMNFDSLKNIKAPEAWVQKAAAIPEAPVQKRAVLPMKRIVAAASMALVSAVGLVVYLLFGVTGSAPVVVPVSPTTAPVSQATERSSDGNIPAAPSEQGESAAPTEQPTGVPDGLQPTETTFAGTEATEAATASTAAGATSPTESSADDPTAPTQPHVPSATVSTEPAEPSAPTAEPGGPSATQPPTENIPLEVPTIGATAVFPSDWISENGEVYCSVYDSGRLISRGKAGCYVMKNGNVFADYETDNAAEPGKTYRYYFYTFSGTAYGSVSGTEVILATGELSY